MTRLGGPFASVVTATLVQPRRGIATVDGRLAVGVTAAVGGYVLGVAAGTAGLGHSHAGWRGRTSLVAAAERALLGCVAAAERALLGCVAAGWLATDGRPGTGITVLLLVVAAAAMGVQSALTISSGTRGANVDEVEQRTCRQHSEQH